MRISDWSADVCASDLRRSGGRDPSANAPGGASHGKGGEIGGATFGFRSLCRWCPAVRSLCCGGSGEGRLYVRLRRQVRALPGRRSPGPKDQAHLLRERSEEHTSELQSLMSISYAVLGLKKIKSRIQQADNEA